MKRIVLIAAAIVTPAFAAPVTFAIDNNHTFPSFSYSHLGYSVQMSRFNKTTGKVMLDKEAETGSVDVTIDMKSVDTGSALFNEHIQGTDYLDTTQFPTATFKSTKVRFELGTPAYVEGNMTMKGVTKPVTLKVTHFHEMMHPMAKREAIGANATATVKRSDFNAGKNVPYVGDEVTINIAIEALKE